MPGAVDFFISRFRELLDKSPEPSSYYRPRPYRNAAVRFRDCSIADFRRRKDLVQEVGLNVFLFPAREIPGCDLLTDSGTTTMTMEQWSHLLLGDESYGSNEGYFDLLNQAVETFGEQWRQKNTKNPNIFIFHQGRAAEHALFSVLIREISRTRAPHQDTALPKGLKPEVRSRIQRRIESIRGRSVAGMTPQLVVPSNSHFDTTEANIESNCMVPLNLPCREHLESDEACPFRGNINVTDLENLMANMGDRVPLIYLTITNNTGGGQPVSLANIKEAKRIADEHGVPLFFDACRFAENAWFIQRKERGHRSKTIQEIVHEMFRYADGFHMSLKKDGLVNIGGAIMIKQEAAFARKYPALMEKLTDHQILTEGHPTYGGLAGRDLKGIVEGLRTVVRQGYLDYRIGQVGRFGSKLRQHNIPVMQPSGGHAIYIDMDRFFEGTQTRDEEFKAISFTALLLIAGHRLCEIGTYVFGRYKDGVETPPDPRVNFVRAAVPRLAYEDQDLFAVAEAVKVLFDHRDRIPGVTVEYGRDLELRHFKSRFRFNP